MHRLGLVAGVQSAIVGQIAAGKQLCPLVNGQLFFCLVLRTTPACHHRFIVAVAPAGAMYAAGVQFGAATAANWAGCF